MATKAYRDGGRTWLGWGAFAVVVVGAATWWLVPGGDPADTAPAALQGTVTVDAVADGEHFGFASRLSGDVLEVDLAEFLVGEQATAAAAADGIDVSGGLPGGFYLRNPDEEVVRLRVAADAEIWAIDSTTVEPRSIDRRDLEAMYSGDLDAQWLYASLRNWPVGLTVEGGLVTRVEEQYVP